MGEIFRLIQWSPITCGFNQSRTGRKCPEEPVLFPGIFLENSDIRDDEVERQIMRLKKRFIHLIDPVGNAEEPRRNA